MVNNLGILYHRVRENLTGRGTHEGSGIGPSVQLQTHENTPCTRTHTHKVMEPWVMLGKCCLGCGCTHAKEVCGRQSGFCYLNDTDRLGRARDLVRVQTHSHAFPCTYQLSTPRKPT